MAYDKNTHHGYADQNSFWEMPISDIAALTGLEESTLVAAPGENRRFAHLIYQVNPSTLELSGNIMVDTDTLDAINADGFATLSGQLDTGIKDIALAVVVEAAGDFTWVADALPGTLQVSALWRVKSLQDTTIGGTQTITTLWADGNGNFDNVATLPLSGLTYS